MTWRWHFRVGRVDSSSGGVCCHLTLATAPRISARENTQRRFNSFTTLDWQFCPSHPGGEKSSRRYDGVSRRHGPSWHPRQAPRCTPDRKHCAPSLPRRRSSRCPSRKPGLHRAAQVIVQRCADERTHSLFSNYVIVGVVLQFRNKLSPVRRERKLGTSGLSAARSPARHVDQNDRQTLSAKSTCELSSTADDLTRRVHGRQTGNAFLQVNHDQGSVGIEFGERHGSSFRRGAHGAGFRSRGQLACFLANRTLNIVLMATMPAKKMTSAAVSPPETLPTRNRT